MVKVFWLRKDASAGHGAKEKGKVDRRIDGWMTCDLRPLSSISVISGRRLDHNQSCVQWNSVYG